MCDLCLIQVWRNAQSRTLAIVLMIAACAACGGGSSTSPTSPTPPSASNPPSARGTWVDAPPTTIGTVEGNRGGNIFPFGGTAPGTSFPATTYQQVYLGSPFGPSQIRLTAAEFFVSPTQSTIFTREVVSASYTFSMSTTTKAVEALDTVNLASNVGANPQVVFSGTIGPGAIIDSQFRVTFSNPFSFAPASGNLLLQIGRSNPGPSTQLGFLSHSPTDGFPTGLSSRAHDFGSNTVPAVYLVTRFYQQRCECPTQAPCTC
jgi:hypothetical protein